MYVLPLLGYWSQYLARDLIRLTSKCDGTHKRTICNIAIWQNYIKMEENVDNMRDTATTYEEHLCHFADHDFHICIFFFYLRYTKRTPTVNTLCVFPSLLIFGRKIII